MAARGPYRVHPARVELHRHGLTVKEVAERAGITASGVCLQLHGVNRVTEPVRAALLERLTPEQAAEVLAAIPSREELAA